MKPFMEQPQFICNDNSTIWPHLWFFHENVNFEGGSPSHPLVFSKHSSCHRPQTADSQFSKQKCYREGSWASGLWAWVKEPFVHPRLWGLVLLGEVSIDCSCRLAAELMGRLRGQNSAEQRGQPMQALQLVFSLVLSGIIPTRWSAPRQRYGDTSPSWGLSGPSWGILGEWGRKPDGSIHLPTRLLFQGPGRISYFKREVGAEFFLDPGADTPCVSGGNMSVLAMDAWVLGATSVSCVSPLILSAFL